MIKFWWRSHIQWILMELVGLSIFLMIHNNIFAQETYSKIIDPGYSTKNFITDLELTGNFLYCSSSHICPSDTNEFIFYSCASISKFDLNRDIDQSLLLDSIFPEGNNRLVIDQNRIIYVGHWRQFIRRN